MSKLYCSQVFSDCKMFLKLQLTWNVIIPPKNLKRDGSLPIEAIASSISNQFADRKTSIDLGYVVAAPTLNKTGEGKINFFTGDILFPVTFSCITFKMAPGEVFQGTAQSIVPLGVFLRCGPADKIYLPHTKMPDYKYVHEDEPFFRNKTSIIKMGAVLRFVVANVSYIEAENEIRVVVSIDEDGLGVVNFEHLNGYSRCDDSSEGQLELSDINLKA